MVAVRTWRGLWCLALAAGALSTAAAQNDLMAPRAYFLAGQPTDVALGDANRDGRLDIFTTQIAGSSNFMGLFVSEFGPDDEFGFPGDVDFLRRIDTPVGRTPQAIAVADFNGDGADDFVTANDSQRSVSFYLSDGRGNMVNQGPTTLSRNLTDVVAISKDTAVAGIAATGHFEPDLEEEGRVFFLTLDSTADFELSEEVIVAKSPEHLAVGDFDSSGETDIVVTHEGQNVISVIFLNNELGEFNTIELATSSPATAVAVGDMDRDGFLDIAATLETANVAVFYGKDGASFEEEFTVPIEQSSEFILLEDLDQDSRLDFIVADADTNRFDVYKHPSPRIYLLQQTFFSLVNIQGMVLGDLDTAGFSGRNLLVASGDSRSIIAHRFNESTDLFEVVITSLPLEDDPRRMTLFSDEFSDTVKLAVSNTDDRSVSVVELSDSAVFNLLSTSEVSGFPPFSLATGTFNDRLDDHLFFGDPASGKVFVYRPLSPSESNTEYDFETVFEVGDNIRDIYVRDVTGDDFNDIILLNSGSDEFGIIPGISDDSDFDEFDEFGDPPPNRDAESNTNYKEFGTDEGPSRLRFLDFDNDGTDEIVIPCAGDDSIVIYEFGDGLNLTGRAEGTISNPVDVALREFEALAGDINNPDEEPQLREFTQLITFAEDRFEVADIIDGDLTEDTRLRETFNVPESITTFAVGELGNDDRDDIVVTNTTYGAIGVYISDGFRTFLPPRWYAVGKVPTDVRLVDYDFDGDQDILVLDRDLSVITLIANERLEIPIPSPPSVKIPGDSNNDEVISPIDAQEALDCYLSNDCVNVEKYIRMDVCPNGIPDGRVTPADAQAIFNMFLNGTIDCP